jgi:hypothetical protein
MKLWQNRITSLSDLPLGSKSAAALAAAHGQRGQRVFKNLLESQELQDAQVHRGVKPQAALVRADGAVHLDAEAPVDLHLPWSSTQGTRNMITRSGSTRRSKILAARYSGLRSITGLIEAITSVTAW